MNQYRPAVASNRNNNKTFGKREKQKKKTKNQNLNKIVFVIFDRYRTATKQLK